MRQKWTSSMLHHHLYWQCFGTLLGSTARGRHTLHPHFQDLQKEKKMEGETSFAGWCIDHEKSIWDPGSWWHTLRNSWIFGTSIAMCNLTMTSKTPSNENGAVDTRRPWPTRLNLREKHLHLWRKTPPPFPTKNNSLCSLPFETMCGQRSVCRREVCWHSIDTEYFRRRRRRRWLDSVPCRCNQTRYSYADAPYHKKADTNVQSEHMYTNWSAWSISTVAACTPDGSNDAFVCSHQANQARAGRKRIVWLLGLHPILDPHEP